jgi:diadenosine tetraphosphate (Ap4A) HIT family hydrolase
MAAVFRLVTELKARCDADFRPAGYNIGVNIGRPAGQTVMHVHVHLIPRYDGDVDDPTGGVRHVIPERANYLQSDCATLPLQEHGK